MMRRFPEKYGLWTGVGLIEINFRMFSSYRYRRFCYRHVHMVVEFYM